MMVAEAWVVPERLPSYLRPDEYHQSFNFDFLKCEWDAEDLRAVVDRCLEADSAVGAPTTWVLANHDVTVQWGAETEVATGRRLVLVVALHGLMGTVPQQAGQ